MTLPLTPLTPTGLSLTPGAPNFDALLGEFPIDYFLSQGSPDATSAYFRALSAAKLAGGGKLVFSPGKRYTVNTRVANSLLWINASNIHIEGYGATLVTTRSDSGGSFITIGENLANVVDYRNQTVYALTGSYVAGVNSLTFATPAHAGNFAAGDYIFIRTGQTLTGTNNPDCEINQVVTANAGTGVVTLRWPTTKPYAQEYYVSGTSGVTSTSVTANLAPFGVSKVTANTIENVSIRGLKFVTEGSGSFDGIDGAQAVGVAIEDCVYEGIGGAVFASFGLMRFRWVRRNRAYTTGTSGGVAYHYTSSVGDTDIWTEDNVGTVQDGISQVHIHEGSANVTIRDNILKSAPGIAGDKNVVSVRARAYNIAILDNTIENGTATNTIYVDASCTGGGVIDGNRLLGAHTNGLAMSAPNWTVGPTNRWAGSGAANVGDVTFFDQSYGAVLRLSNRVTPTLSPSFLGVLPAFSYVTRVEYWVEEAFNSGTSDTISVGYAGNQTFVAAAASVRGVSGIVTPTRSIGLNRQDRQLNAYWTGVGAAPTAGKVVIVVEYVTVRDAYS